MKIINGIMTDYDAQLQDIRWKEFRLKVFEQDHYICQLCFKKFSENKLEAHHKKYLPGRMAWEYNIRDLVSLCHFCHNGYHQDVKFFQLIIGLIKRLKFRLA